MSPTKAYTEGAKRRARKARNTAERKRAAEADELSTRGVIAMIDKELDDQARERETARPKIRKKPWMDQYLESGLITREQHEAGDRYYKTWRSAGLEPLASKPDSTIVNTQRSMPGCGPGYAEYMTTVRALGVQLSSCVESVCCFNEPYSHWEKRWSLPKGSGKEYLRDGLEALEKHYRK